MALKSERPSVGFGRGAKKTTFSLKDKTQAAGFLATKALSNQRRVALVETIEAR